MKLFWLIIGLVIILVLTEVALFIVPINTFAESRLYITDNAFDYPHIFQKEKRLLWRFRPSQEFSLSSDYKSIVRINSIGLRNEKIPDKGNNFRIIILGNSSAFGLGIPDSLTFARILENSINSDDSLPGVEIINAGIPGYGSFQGRRFYTEELYKLKPDMIILMFGWNDQQAGPDGIQDKYRDVPSEGVLGFQNIISKLNTIGLICGISNKTGKKQPEELFGMGEQPQYRVSLEDYSANLKAIARFAFNQKTSVIIMTSPMPSLYKTNNESTIGPFHENYNMIARQAAKASTAGLVDLAFMLSEYDSLFIDPQNDPISFNIEGHRLTAESIYAFLKSHPEYFNPPDPPEKKPTPLRLR